MESLPKGALMARRQSIRRRAAAPGTIVIALLVLIFVYLYTSGALGRWRDSIAQGRTSLTTRTPSADDLQVFFTTPALVYPDVPGQRTTSPLLRAVLADIATARKSIDLATFDFDIPEITEALIRAKQRGIEVRVIVDSENLDTPEVSQQTGQLQTAGIPVHYDRREPFMHNKFIVIDRAVAWTGSWNVTTNELVPFSLQH